MIEKMIYPKTTRVKSEPSYITEKLDGSNLVIFRLCDKIHIAQRNYIYELDEILNGDYRGLKGLKGWLQDNHDKIKLNEGSAICGEWLGTGKIKYPNDWKRFHMFAKANVTEDYSLKNIVYKNDLFMYSFINKEVPDCIEIVKPLEFISDSSINNLNYLYMKYSMEFKRDIEGFIVISNNHISKYVRMKNGKMTHHEEGKS